MKPAPFKVENDRELEAYNAGYAAGQTLDLQTVICMDHANVASPACEYVGCGLVTLEELIQTFGDGHDAKYREALQLISRPGLTPRDEPWSRGVAAQALAIGPTSARTQQSGEPS